MEPPPSPCSAGCSAGAESLLAHARAADQAIWVVAFLLYACDAARLLHPRALLLVEAARGRLRPLISDNPFTAGGRAVMLAPLHLPGRGVFLATWGRPWVDAPDLRTALESITRLRGSLRVVRGLASLAFGLLFVVGPGLTLALGPDAAVVWVALALYPAVLLALVVMWRRRQAFGFTTGGVARLTVELIVCPAFLPNLVRRITMHRPLDVDGAQILAATAPPEVSEDFVGRLQARAEDLIDAAGPDLADQASLRTYLAALRSAR